MNSINVKNVSNLLSDKEMKSISGSRGLDRTCIRCITGPNGEGYNIGDYNDCYFHLCKVDDGVLCWPCEGQA